MILVFFSEVKNLYKNKFWIATIWRSKISQ